MYELRRIRQVFRDYTHYKAEYEASKMERMRAAGLWREEFATDKTTKLKRQSLPRVKPKDKSLFGERRVESELVMRGEDKRGIFQVDNKLTQGPQVYIVVDTIYEQVPAELLEMLGVPVMCVMKVGKDLPILTPKMNSEYAAIVKEINDPTYFNAINLRKNINLEKEDEIKNEEIRNFWLEFNKRTQNPDSSKCYEETVLGKYLPPLETVDMEEPEWKEQLKTKLYKEIAQIMFNQYQIKQLFKDHKKAEEKHIVKPDFATYKHTIDLSRYNGILDKLPQECITIPVIFDTIIKEVETMILETKEEEEKEPPVVGQELALIKPLDDHEVTPNLRETSLQEKLEKLHSHYDLKNHLPKVVIPKNVLDKKLRFKTLRTLKGIYSLIFDGIDIPAEQKGEYAKHLKLFQKGVGTIKQSKLLTEMLIALKVIENTWPCSHDKKEDLLQMEENEQEQNAQHESLLEREINQSKHKPCRHTSLLVDSMNCLQQLKPDKMLVTLFDLETTCNTSEKVYIPILDSFLWKFCDCSKKTKGTVVMQTPVCLKDFFKYTLREREDWTVSKLSIMKKETVVPSMSEQNLGGRFRDSMVFLPSGISSQFTASNSKLVAITDSPVDKASDTVIWYLMEKKYLDTFASTMKESKPDDTDSIDLNTTSKTEHKSETINFADESKESINKKKRKDIGPIYDLGPIPRVHYKYTTLDALFQHGSKVSLDFRHKAYGRKSVELNLESSGHKLSYNSNVHINNEKIKLALTHETGVQFIFKECYRQQVDVVKYKPKEASDLTMADHLDNCEIKSSPNLSNLLISTYNLTIVWPYGYVIEVKHLSDNIKYIKHYFIDDVKHPFENEVFRIYTPDPMIIKVYNDNSLQMMFPSGTKIICSKYFWVHKPDEVSLVMDHYIAYQTNGKVYTVSFEVDVTEETMQIQESVSHKEKYRLVELENGISIKQTFGGQQITTFDDDTTITSELTWIDNFIVQLEIDNLEETIQREEEYVFVSMKVTIKHPNFATVNLDVNENSFVITTNHDVKVTANSDTTCDVSMGEEVLFSVLRDKVTFDKFLSKTLFEHTAVVPNTLKYNMIPKTPLTHILARDLDGNEVNLNTQSHVNYKYTLSDQSEQCTKFKEHRTRFILVRRDLSGFELFTQDKLSKIMEQSQTLMKHTMKSLYNELFTEIIVNVPFYHNKKYQFPKQEPHFPSTYGKEFYFPFKIKEKEDQPFFDESSVCKIKTLLRNQKDIYANALQLYKETLYRKGTKTCICRKRLRKHSKHKHEFVLQFPNKDFMEYLKNNIMRSALLLAHEKIFEYRLKNDQMDNVKRLISKQVPPYFDSIFGMAYFITKEVQEESIKKINLQPPKEKPYPEFYFLDNII